MAIRLSGMNSGLDTDAIVEALISAKSEKKKTLEGEQKKLQWKQDAWKSLNSKIYNFYSKSLSDTRLKSDYLKKTTTSSSSAVSVVTSSSSPNCVQEMRIVSLAKSGYHTGAQLKTTNEAGKEVKASYTNESTLADLGISFGEDGTGSKTFSFTVAGESKSIEVTGDMTLSSFTSKLSAEGINANFDAKNQRFFISAKGNGTEKDFEYGADADTTDMLNKMGLGAGMGVRLAGSDAEIELNGETFTSTSNTLEVNGLTITLNNSTSDTITLTTKQDAQGAYDVVKNFIKQYNELINEMDKLYNAESAKNYRMLSKEEKEEMSEDEVKEWEDKIKSALLRSDSTVNSVSSAMKSIMLQGVKMSDGTTLHLSDFGIATGGYFTSADNEKNAYHIDGDKDDTSTSGNEDKLSAMIAADPEKVAEFFSSLSKNLYSKLDNLMARSEFSSAFTVYNDKLMTTQYNDYKTKIADQEKKVTTWEDYYYKKFTAMESALATLQSKQNSIAGLFGGN